MKKSIFSGLILSLSLSAFSQSITPMSPTDGYNLDVISEASALDIFKNIKNEYKKDSTCANRAMIWAFETYNTYNVNSEKYFIHYTDLFNHIANNDGEHLTCFFGWCPGADGWEYHVASSFNVDGELMVFDKYFLPNAPVTPEAWERRFIDNAEEKLNKNAAKIIAQLKKNISKERLKESKKQKDRDALALIAASKGPDGKYHISCKRITHIAEHDLDQRKSWCHTQRTSMYYWNQLDLRTLNNGSKNIITKDNYTDNNILKGMDHKKTDFGYYSIEYSYNEAFPKELIPAQYRKDNKDNEDSNNSRRRRRR